MPRIDEIPPEIRKAEGAKLAAYFSAAQDKEPNLSQVSLATEMDVTHGMVNKWFTGRSPIAGYRLVWLAKRLGFNPTDIRANLDEATKAQVDSEMDMIILEVMKRDPHARAYIEGLIKASPAYAELLANNNQ